MREESEKDEPKETILMTTLTEFPGRRIYTRL